MHSHRLLTLACASVLLSATAPTWAGSFLDRIKERVQERRAAQDPGAAAQHSDTPEPPGHHTPSVRDLAYGSDPRQRMDVYLPAKPVNAPVILMVHGGGWRWGDKAASAVVDNKAARWLARGFVFVSVNNRLLPQADPLEQARDVAQALAVAQAQAPSWGADPARFILMGHSAGAHLVALVNASPELGPQAGAKAWLGTVALDSAAVDVTPIMQGSHFRLYDAAFGTDPAFWRAVSPLQQLTASAKPMLAVCSSRRSDACAQADVFAERAAQLGVRAQVLRQDLSHRDINQSLGLAGAYTDAVEAFMASLDAAVAKVLATPQTPAPAKLSQP
ncbi:MAG: alpha/beta hydrolase [Burkholderiales bacterium]|nr:alpha/beta hydrolase [Burkholderiales bacterium]